MERSSTIFAISSHFYDNSYNRGHYHRAAGTQAVPNSWKPRMHATPAYTWIVERELAALAKDISETRRWAVEQQAHFGLLPTTKVGAGPSTLPPRTRTAEKRRRDPDPTAGGRELDEEMAWLRERLRAAQRHAERIALQEEFNKMEARWRKEERSSREEERRQRRRQEYHRAGGQREREADRRRQAEAWKAYESHWATIATGNDNSPLRFRSVPWPMTLPPRSEREVTSEAVAKFILSHAHSEGVSRKDRIKSALRRWHPDRFGRILNRVDVKDRAAVERGVGTVVRCLNDLLAREK
ncbi:hypothetical protein EI94DRAFT_1740687 [Lactarius quietus]|nr:hypothetical protein EI94DRAFT_1740687 [Lactarius quietus]